MNNYQYVARGQELGRSFRCGSSHSLVAVHISPSYHHVPMTSEEQVAKKYNLITRRLQEVLGGDIIKGILAEGRSPKGYWGMRPAPYP